MPFFKFFFNKDCAFCASCKCDSFDFFSPDGMWNILLKNHISVAPSPFCVYCEIVKALQLHGYIRMGSIWHSGILFVFRMDMYFLIIAKGFIFLTELDKSGDIAFSGVENK